MDMVLWLRKTFIRDYERLDDPLVRSRHGTLSSWIGIFLNLILVGLKLSSAFLLASANHWIFSMALIGDALNNFFDFSSSIIALIGFQMARKPADKEHPYGHGRAEYIAGMLIGVAILVSAGMLAFRSVQSIVHQDEVSTDIFAFLALALTLPLKGLQSYINFSLGKTLSSPTLTAVGRDAIIDVALSTSLLIGFFLAKVLSFPNLDGYLGAVVSLFLCYAGIRALKEATDPLLGEAPSATLQREVEEIVLGFEEVHGVHDFLCHSYGENVRFLSFHVELDGSLSLKKAHDLLEAIEEKVSERTHSSVVVHPDPIDSEVLLKYEDKVTAILAPYQLTYHDLHLSEGTLNLEVLLPFGFKEEDKKKIEADLRSLSENVHVVFDHPYAE